MFFTPCSNCVAQSINIELFKSLNIQCLAALKSIITREIIRLGVVSDSDNHMAGDSQHTSGLMGPCSIRILESCSEPGIGMPDHNGDGFSFSSEKRL